ncbi:CRISPR-associated endonuclease Cas3'' [Truepera radiovictrix]|nr:CRISPR-associated endonuclease Cas3'' [Truepera radiovictrix]
MAHSPSEENPRWQTLKAHAEGVSARLEHHLRYLFESVPELRPYAKLTAYLHDLGKYRDGFQEHRLGWNPHTQRPEAFPRRALEHSDAGAKFVQALLEMDRETASEVPFVIASHHGRLHDVDALLRRLQGTDLAEVETLMERAIAELPELEALLDEPLPDLPLDKTARAFLIRFLLSALVDADRLDTEAHGNPSKAELRNQHAAEQDEMRQLLERVRADQDEKAAEDGKDPQPINALRREMYASALGNAALPPGFFRLTMPTGGGKTLTSLAFALEHARQHGLRRVIYAVPFTTIIDQTAKVFREVLERCDFKVLEHHSNLEVKEPKEGEENQTTAPDLATENWDAPVIVTTTVRLFQETLFGTRTAQLRRLHNVSGSVIVLDEAQTLPANLLQPTLDALSFLVKYARCSVVLCTATQPALDERLGFPALKGIRELVPDAARYFNALKRVEYAFRIAEPTPWVELADELKKKEQVLCIVNTRQHASDLYTLLGEDEANFHLSTHLCPAHRQRELAVIKQRLGLGKPCRVVSTQLIEAGINVDFPTVYRALGPLEAIVQAAGRCNREGLLKDENDNPTLGQVIVFLPEDHRTPPGDYEVRTTLTQNELTGTDLHDPTVFTTYFREVYSRISQAPEVEVAGGRRPFQKAHAELYFAQVAKAYRMIEGETLPVIIRGYDPVRVTALLGTLRDSQNREERQRAWRALQQYTVNLQVYQAKGLEPFLGKVAELEERARWRKVEPPYLREWPASSRYHDKLGIVPEFNTDLLTSF